MKLDEAQGLLAEASDDDGPVVIPESLLPQLKLDDIPEGTSFQVGEEKDGVVHLEWEGRLYRSGDFIEGEAEHIWTRKYWYSPLGLEQYMDLVRRAVETRHRLRGDVDLTHYDDDGAYIHLLFAVKTGESSPAKGFRPRPKDLGRAQRSG